MELRRRLDFRQVATIIYIVLFVIYIIVGLRSADAKSYEISGFLEIPAIGLSTDVAKLELVDGTLDTPDTLAGSFSRYDSKIFLVGHRTTVFQNLASVYVGDEVIYNDELYQIVDSKVLAKSEINMTHLYAATSEKTLVIMTCAGETLPDGDATHRLIITARIERGKL